VTALLRAALAGAATGGRAFTGVAALVLATPARPATQPDRALSLSWVKRGAALLAAGELAADKLPQAPSRLALPGLGLRCGAAAAAGLIIARRAQASGSAAGRGYPSAADSPSPDVRGGAVACAAVATAAAVGAAWLGTRWRSWAAGHIGPDYIGAGLEDAVVVSLAGLSTRG
jgi:hypothetical protein